MELSSDVESQGQSDPKGDVDWKIVIPSFLFPALGGGLFGYDIGATGGALISLTSEATSGTDWCGARTNECCIFQIGHSALMACGNCLISTIKPKLDHVPIGFFQDRLPIDHSLELFGIALTALFADIFNRYNLSPFQSGAVVSASLIGALIGSGAAFVWGNAIGRRKELLLAAALYGMHLSCRLLCVSSLIYCRQVF